MQKVGEGGGVDRPTKLCGALHINIHTFAYQESYHNPPSFILAKFINPKQYIFLVWANMGDIIIKSHLLF